MSPRLVLCSGITSSADELAANNRLPLALDSLGTNANVNIQLDDVSRAAQRLLSNRLVDFLEIASYVFSADSAVRRGNGWRDDGSTEAWGRDFHFVIPVRDPDFWNRGDVVELLVQTLKFLSDDEYRFEFPRLTTDRPVQDYLQFGPEWESWLFEDVSRVVMFSGGLDSLAGAAEMAASGDNLVLVSHRSAPPAYTRQRDLFQHLQQSYPSVKMLHVPVWINKDGGLGRDATQRTRSFLYTAIGTVVAQTINASGVRFFENGVVSLNLPLADEVVRARASRTTHPWSLNMLERLVGLITDRDIKLENPFIFFTKTEVVQKIVDVGAAHLIGKTCSCAHTIFKSKTQWHCGACSQCIDRRAAILAAGQGANDLAIDYRTDVFTGPRAKLYEQNVAIDYVRLANEICTMSDEAFSVRFSGQLTRAIRPFPNRADAATKFAEMHQRHAQSVREVLVRQVHEHACEIAAAELESTSMLALVCGQQHLESTWKRYSDRIADMLQTGLPTACRTHKPKDERHLQELSDAILRASENDLIREYPYLPWGSSLTKPDWSAEQLSLLVELKFVRRNQGSARFSDDIAADITKYGARGQHVLFVVYDPDHLIKDDDAFAEEVRSNPMMMIRFIR